MKILWSYFRKHIWVLALFFLFGAIFWVMLRLAGLPQDELLYAFLLCFVFGLLAAGLGLWRYAKAVHALREGLMCLPENLIPLPETGELERQTYREMIYLLREAYQQERTAVDRQQSDMTDYFALWVHQIKTPIAASHLLLQSEELDRSLLSSELFQIERYVEMALQYLRIRGKESDFVFQRHQLDGIVRQAVRKYAPLFIRSGVQLDYTPLDVEVLTDEKWLCFVLEQLLSNALKYTSGGKVSIFLKEPTTLIVQDTGIGIAAEDLPRVFESGFTGYNGRINKKASGIGLYLCKTVMDQLGHGIQIESCLGKGTSVFLNLDVVRTIHE